MNKNRIIGALLWIVQMGLFTISSSSWGSADNAELMGFLCGVLCAFSLFLIIWKGSKK